MKCITLCLLAATILLVNEVSSYDLSSIEKEAKKKQGVYEVKAPPPAKAVNKNDSHRHRRSAESSEEEEEKSPFSSIGKAFDYVKDSVKGAYHNVTNSDAAAKVSDQLGKIKDGIKETGKKVKAAVHDYTAPATDQAQLTQKELQQTVDKLEKISST